MGRRKGDFLVGNAEVELKPSVASTELHFMSLPETTPSLKCLVKSCACAPDRSLVSISVRPPGRSRRRSGRWMEYPAGSPRGAHECELEVIDVEALRAAVRFHVRTGMPGRGRMREGHVVLAWYRQQDPGVQRYRGIVHDRMEGRRAGELSSGDLHSHRVGLCCRRSELDPHADRIQRAVVHLVVDADLRAVKRRYTIRNKQTMGAAMRVRGRIRHGGSRTRAPPIHAAVLEIRREAGIKSSTGCPAGRRFP